MLAWNWQPDSETPLLLLANRDEFYARPTLPLPLLQDSTLAADAKLPVTGVPLELERHLSATWIHSEHCGTRASSIVALGARQIAFFEQGYGAEGMLAGTQHIFTRTNDLHRA